MRLRTVSMPSYLASFGAVFIKFDADAILALRREISQRGSRFSLFYRRTRSIKITNLRKSAASQSILRAKFLLRGH